jgi:MFS family permease
MAVRVRVRNPLLAERDGKLIFAIQLCDTLGFGLGVIALPWLVLHETGSGALSGLAGAFGTLPYVLFGLFAGVAGDRLARKKILLVAYPFKVVAAATIPAWAAFHHGYVPLALILSAAFCIGAGRTFVDSAVFGAVAEIVSPEGFIEGQAVLTLSWSTGQVLGPIVGGALLAAVGGADVIAVEAAMFAAGSLLVPLLRVGVKPPNDARQSVLELAREGVRIVFNHPLLRVLTTTGFAWFFCTGAVQSLLVAYYSKSLHFDKVTLSLALATTGLTGGACALFIPALSRRFGSMFLFSLGTGGVGVAIVGLATANGAPLAFMWAAFFGVAMQVGVTMLVSERQRHAAWELQSRVGISGRMVSLLGVALGGFVGSGAASLVPLRVVYVVAGAIAIVVTALAAPAIRRTEREEPTILTERQAA